MAKFVIEDEERLALRPLVIHEMEQVEREAGQADSARLLTVLLCARAHLRTLALALELLRPAGQGRNLTQFEAQPLAALAAAALQTDELEEIQRGVVQKFVNRFEI